MFGPTQCRIVKFLSFFFFLVFFFFLFVGVCKIILDEDKKNRFKIKFYFGFKFIVNPYFQAETLQVSHRSYILDPELAEIENWESCNLTSVYFVDSGHVTRISVYLTRLAKRVTDSQNSFSLRQNF